MGKMRMLIGLKTNKLTAIGIHSRVKYKNSTKLLWTFRCECGGKAISTAYEVISGHTKSCGCLRGSFTKHGHNVNGIPSKTYNSWRAMIERCKSKDGRNAENYTARGIKVCDEWKKFKNFLEDMGERPDGLTLDRIDNSKGYSKENCRWATYKVQANNRRGLTVVNIDGVDKTITDWSSYSGVKWGTIYMRLKRGITGEALLTRGRLKNRDIHEVKTPEAAAAIVDSYNSGPTIPTINEVPKGFDR